MKLYLVGGAVREHMLGRFARDYDFAVEAESYEAMREGLLARGLVIWQERPEFVTLRGQMPRATLGDFSGLLPEADASRGRVMVPADFTLCRAEAQYSDLRHPDVVTPADIATDLSRRDFTVNAVAVDEDDYWHDPHGGMEDAKHKTLRAVGDPRERFEEDPLRMLRALRFAVVARLVMEYYLDAAMRDRYLTNLLATLPVERVREELSRMMRHDWHQTMQYLVDVYPNVAWVLAQHHPSLWFRATIEER